MTLARFTNLATMPKASKRRVKSLKLQDKKRKERRFSTSSTYMPTWVALLGMVGCFGLGAGVFGLWILDPPVTWSSYAVAAGGLALGLALWFGQPPEVAVAVGDAGVAIEGSHQTQRLNWYEMRAVRAQGGRLLIEGDNTALKFSIGANLGAAALLLKEAAERIPDVLDVDPQVSKALPDPQTVRGLLQDIEDDQVAGTPCAASGTVIKLEEDARVCPCCGQIYEKAHLPSSCVSCENQLGENALRA